MKIKTHGAATICYENGTYYWDFEGSSFKSKPFKLQEKEVPVDYVPYYKELKKRVERKAKLEKLLSC